MAPVGGGASVAGDRNNRDRVRRALDVLKPYLATYLRQKLDGRPDAKVAAGADVAALLKIVVERWEGAFAGSLPLTVRHYAHLLRDVRNRWAHEENFSDRETRHAIETVWLTASAIKAPSDALAEIDRLNEANGAIPRRTDDEGPPPSARPVRSPRGPTPVRRDAHGVILNAEELTADDVAMQRVLCPACREKVFEEWSAGWDAHAEHRCNGLKAATAEERKEEFRERFGHLFRGPGGRATRSRQRDMMKRLWTRHAPDEERTVREYAAAERRGEVTRVKNTYGITPEDYAHRLLADGLKKGWLPRQR